MGTCASKPPKPNPYAARDQPNDLPDPAQTPKSPESRDLLTAIKQSPFFPFYTPSPAHGFKVPKSPANSTPMRIFRRPFPPPSPAKHIKAVLRRRREKKAVSIPEDEESEEPAELDKRFGLSKEFTSRLEVEEEVGRGHFGYTCSAKFKKGERKGQKVAVKVIPKSKVGRFPILLTSACLACICFDCQSLNHQFFFPLSILWVRFVLSVITFVLLVNFWVPIIKLDNSETLVLVGMRKWSRM